MARLGRKQLELLKSVGCSFSVIVADKLTRSLCERGLMKEGVPGGFVRITPNGLRALADAADQGRITLFKDLEKTK